MPAILKTLLETTLIASAMIVAVLAVRSRLSKRMHPAVMLMLWALVLLRLCLPVMLASPVHLPDLLPKRAAEPLTAASTAPSIPPEIRMPPAAGGVPLPVQAAAAGPGAVPIPRADTAKPSFLETVRGLVANISLWEAAAAIWALGAALVLLSELRRAWRFRRKLRVCRYAASGGVLRAVRRHTLDIGIRRDVEVLECDFVCSPAVFGCFRPVILLPSQFLRNMDRARLDGILLHELFHIKRRDMLLNYLWLLAKAVHWFNPLVWIAYRAFTGDVELCRDRMVADRLGPSACLDYGQSLIDAARFVGKAQAPMPSDAASLFGDASGVKERVVRLLRPQRRSRASALAAATLAALMVFTCFTTACQPTPTKPIVVNKNDGKLEAAIKATATPTPTIDTSDASSGDAAQSTVAPTPFPAPEHLKYELPGVKDDFVVQVDADVSMPDTGVFPVVKAAGDVFSQETVDKVREALLPGQMLYEPTTVMTKSDIQEQIDYYQKELKGSIDGGYDQLVKSYKQILKDLMAQQAKAPDSVEHKPANTTLHFSKDGQNLLLIYGKKVTSEDGKSMTFEWTPEGLKQAEGDGYLSLTEVTPFADGVQKSFDVTTHQAGKSPQFTFQSIRYGELNGKNEHHIDGLTGEQAEALAQDLLQKMGLPFTLVAATVEGYDANPELDQSESHYFHLIYKRDVGSIPQNNFTRPRNRLEEMALNDKLREEEIAFTIDNKGIQGFTWNDPARVQEVENTNVKLLSFDEIKAIFDKQIVTTYEAMPKDDNDIRSQRLVIYKVTLSTMPVRIQDEPGTFRYVPVWDFCGKLIGKYGDDYAKGTSNHYVLNDDNERVVMGQGESLGDTQDMSFLTINAIDGSIINRNKGY